MPPTRRRGEGGRGGWGESTATQKKREGQNTATPQKEENGSTTQKEEESSTTRNKEGGSNTSPEEGGKHPQHQPKGSGDAALLGRHSFSLVLLCGAAFLLLFPFGWCCFFPPSFGWGCFSSSLGWCCFPPSSFWLLSLVTENVWNLVGVEFSKR